MWVWGPRGLRALRLCVPAPKAGLLPLRPSPRRASRANMGQEEELLRIAKKLEKMVARKNTVRLQSLGHNSRPREARRVRARSPGGACWLGAREARAGLRHPSEARLVQGSLPLGGCWAPQGGLVHGAGRRLGVRRERACPE